MSEKATERMSIGACTIVAIILVTGALLVGCSVDTPTANGKTVYELEERAEKITAATANGPMVFERPRFIELRDSCGKVFIRANDGRRYLIWQGHVFEGE